MIAAATESKSLQKSKGYIATVIAHRPMYIQRSVSTGSPAPSQWLSSTAKT